jgi:hypothetical protein
MSKSGHYETQGIVVRFQVLTAASMKFRFVIWDVLPCKIIVDRRFTICCHHHQGDLNFIGYRYLWGQIGNLLSWARTQVLPAAWIKVTVLWDVAPCTFPEINSRLRGSYCLHHQGDDHRPHGAACQKTVIILSRISHSCNTEPAYCTFTIVSNRPIIRIMKARRSTWDFYRWRQELKFGRSNA